MHVLKIYFSDLRVHCTHPPHRVLMTTTIVVAIFLFSSCLFLLKSKKSKVESCPSTIHCDTKWIVDSVS
jgi:uncharacterized membrane protein